MFISIHVYLLVTICIFLLEVEIKSFLVSLVITNPLVSERDFVLDPKVKASMTIDYIFGKGVSKALPVDKLVFTFSKRTGRMIGAFLDGKTFFTVRTDGSIALTILGAKTLLRIKNFRNNCITIERGVEDFISAGKSVFCKHVVKCGKRIRPGSEVVVLDNNGNVIGVGKAILSSRMIERFKRGVAVKVRHGGKLGGF